MRLTFRLARIGGTNVTVHATFGLLVVAFVALALERGHTAATLAQLLILLVLSCACVVAHEFGHVAAARFYGIETKEVTLLPIGAVSRLAAAPADPITELVIAAAGPLVSICLAAFCGVIAIGAGDGARLHLSEVAIAGMAAKLFWTNIIIACINLLPALPLDGGKLLRAALLPAIGDGAATRLAVSLSYGTSLLFLVAGYTIDPVFYLMAGLVLVCARREIARLAAERLAKRPLVETALSHDFICIAADAPVVALVDVVFGQPQREFPVTRDGYLVGVLTRAAVARSLAGGRSGALAADICSRGACVADVSEELHAVMARMRQLKLSLVPVADGGICIGAVRRPDAEAVSLQYAAQLGALDDWDDAEETTREAG